MFLTLSFHKFCIPSVNAHNTAGLNNVIRELVHALYYLYDVNAVYGIVGGFHGFYKPEYKPVKLTPKMVDEINHEGGTVLRSSRGGFDIDKIITFLQEREISQLYVIVSYLPSS